MWDYGFEVHGNTTIAQIVGRRLEQILISTNGYLLTLVTADGKLVLEADGDCCSESWWADVFTPKQTLCETITGFEILELPDPEDGRTRQEYDQAYGFKLLSPRGDTVFAFRNSSNGYYRGSCSPKWVESQFANQFVGKVATDQFDITEDWAA